MTCDSNCEQCEDDPTTCLSCTEGDILIESTSKCKIKKDITKNGYWQDSLDGIIKRCVRPCRLCDTTGSTCIQCFNNYYMSAPGICSKCSLECSTCVVSATQCTSCHMGYQLDTSAKCNAVCERYEYLDTVSGECMLCPYPCSTCNPIYPFNCLTCITSFYYVPSTYNCLTCNDKCRSCTGPLDSQCTSCFYAF